MQLNYAEFVGQVSCHLRTNEVAFSEVAKTAGLEVPLHTHADPHFQFVLEGQFTTNAAGANGFCGPGTLIFCPAGITHRDQFVSAHGRFATTSFQACFVAQLSSSEHLIDYPLAYRDQPVAWVATRLWHELCHADSITTAVVEALAIELLAHAALSSAKPVRKPAWIDDAIAMIEDNFAGSVRVFEIARAVDVHPFHLTRVFQRYVGCSTGEYLRHCRVRRACELLRKSRFPLSQIAFQSGFSDQSELTKALRRYTKFTPARYRAAFIESSEMLQTPKTS